MQPQSSFVWLSAPGLSALSVLHLRGPGAPGFLSRRGMHQVDEVPRHGWLKNSRGEALDEVMAAREEVGITLTCHGGPAVRAAIEAELCAEGFVPASAIELPLFGANSRYEREILRLLTAAQSDKGVEYCLWALQHGEQALEAALQNATMLPELLQKSAATRYFFDPLRVHLCGPVNAGKSSLLNALCAEKLAEVGDEPGLTRDVIEGRFEHQGCTVRVFDTPGELSSGGELEQRAFSEAREYALATGDVLLFLVPPGAAPPQMQGTLVVHSRIDESSARESARSGFPCAVSVRQPETIVRLKDHLISLQAPGVSPAKGDAFALIPELQSDLWGLSRLEVEVNALRAKWLE